MGVIFNQALANPISSMTNALKNGQLPKSDNYIQELQFLCGQINKYYEGKDKIGLAELARSAAHDIRSPLTALETATRDLSNITEQKQLLIASATRHIRDIANNLLQKNTELETYSLDEISNVLLVPVVDYVISEVKNNTGTNAVDIKATFSKESLIAWTKVVPMELKRLLSNICNNSLDAIAYTGAIKIKTWVNESYINISISDNGKGIPEEKINLIFNEGVSYKRDGSGLGLYHAKQWVKRWNGNIKIKSIVNHGTTLVISLPLQEPEVWFANSIPILKDSEFVIVDDTTSIKGVWQQRISEIKHNKANIKYFSTPDLFLDWYQTISPELKRRNVYLIDHKFIGEKLTGIDIISKLNPFSLAFLVTSKAEERQIQSQCSKLCVKLIPKYYAPHIPINIISKTPDIILLEKSASLCQAWQNRAKLKKLQLNYYSSKNKFYSEVKLFSRQTPIYISEGYLNIVETLLLAGFVSIYIIAHNPTAIDSGFKNITCFPKDYKF